jgi:hypothetical protein
LLSSRLIGGEDGAALHGGGLGTDVVIASHRWWRWRSSARRPPRQGRHRRVSRAVKLSLGYAAAAPPP